MKIRILILLSLFANCLLSYAQEGNYSRGLQYLDKDVDTSMLFMDIVVNNYNNNPVSAVGVDRTERVFHYSSSHRYGETLYMMSVFYQIAAVEYSEYFIFDSYQNLIKYAYKSLNVEFICKIEDENIVNLKEDNLDLLSENYFLLDPDMFFAIDAINERCDLQFKYCKSVTGIPNYSEEVLKIREAYKSINADKNLQIEKVENVSKYFEDNKLVKMVISLDRTYEYYFNNGSLIFAFADKYKDLPELRIYCCYSQPFKILSGSQNLQKEQDDFWNYSDEVLGLYHDYLTDENY